MIAALKGAPQSLDITDVKSSYLEIKGAADGSLNLEINVSGDDSGSMEVNPDGSVKALHPPSDLAAWPAPTEWRRSNAD